MGVLDLSTLSLIFFLPSSPSSPSASSLLFCSRWAQGMGCQLFPPRSISERDGGPAIEGAINHNTLKTRARGVEKKGGKVIL